MISQHQQQTHAIVQILLSKNSQQYKNLQKHLQQIQRQLTHNVKNIKRLKYVNTIWLL